MKRLFLAFFAVLAVTLADKAAAPTIASRVDALPLEGRAWVDSVFSSLTERQRIAQLFVPRLDITDNAAGRAQLDKMVAAGIGGFLLGKGTIADYAALISRAQSRADVPLMVTLDGEWGLSMRVADTPRFPYNMALGAISDPELLTDYGRELARECHLLGINVDFAPVLDVNSNPDNPVIGYRSFGENPERVAILGTAFSGGLEQGGVLSVAKHFPGHGDTSTDSHKTLPIVNHSMSWLRETDLVPFSAYIRAGLGGVMVGHLNIPALDPSGTPTSLSSKAVTDLLKNEMGFRGLVFTDALAMKGADSQVNNCVRAIRAGADVLLGSGAPLADIDAVAHAVADGTISRAAIDDACRKMLAYKWVLGLNRKPQLGTVAEITAAINSAEAREVNSRLCRGAITVVRDRDGLLPLDGADVAVVSIGADASNRFAETVREFTGARLYAANADGTIPSATLAALKRASTVIVAVFNDKAPSLSALSRLDGLDNVVPVFFLNPYRMASFAPSLKRRGTLVAALDDTPGLREAAARAITGDAATTGRFPVTVAGVAALGDGVDVRPRGLGSAPPADEGFIPGLEESLDAIVTDALNSGAFPGCQVLVARGHNIVYNKAFGSVSCEPGAPAVTDATLYDLASMTKVIATATGIMRAVDLGLIRLDDNVATYLPTLADTPVGSITLRSLLLHESGLPPSLNIYKLVMDTTTYTAPLITRKPTGACTIRIADGVYGNADAQLRPDLVSSRRTASFPYAIASEMYASKAMPDTLVARIAALTPGKWEYRYSDLNFILLRAIEEAATGVGHEDWVEESLLEPLGLENMMFRPLRSESPDRIAATERDPYLRRGQLLQGYVHDELAAFSGGVEGNAGLFANATDVATYARMMLDGGMYGSQQVLSSDVVNAFTRTRGSGGRGLAFDRPSGGVASPRAFGHTGFTGTCFWADPDADLIFVFLSNRVCPTRDNPAFARSNIRARLLREVYAHL